MKPRDFLIWHFEFHIEGLMLDILQRDLALGHLHLAVLLSFLHVDHPMTNWTFDTLADTLYCNWSWRELFTCKRSHRWIRWISLTSYYLLLQAVFLRWWDVLDRIELVYHSIALDSICHASCVEHPSTTIVNVVLIVIIEFDDTFWKRSYGYISMCLRRFKINRLLLNYDYVWSFGGWPTSWGWAVFVATWTVRTVRHLVNWRRLPRDYLGSNLVKLGEVGLQNA